MESASSSPHTVGSEWHRWDPHLHAPGTLLSDQFGGNWESYLQRIEGADPTVRALGVTDYFCIRTYQEVRRLQQQGRLPNVRLLFPNVEMRLDIKTEKQKGINLHLLFSPHDPDHEAHIERILGRLQFDFQGSTYSCTIDEFARLGRAHDKRQVDKDGAIKTGANQFKVTLDALRGLFRREDWLHENCLVAVSGMLGDGTPGLQGDDSFAATRREIESFADIVFSATPGARDFWIGKKAGFDKSYVESTYRCLKPCLHGSDAHRDEKVVAPDLERRCWIKGDLTFEALRQAVLEPEDRVWIGQAPPPGTSPSFSIRNVEVSDAPWLATPSLPLNSGLIAIIGARGSGKTALADVIAQGASALGQNQSESSFLRRASTPVDLLGSASVALLWGDGSPTGGSLQPSPEDFFEPEPAQVQYLSQQFVDQLCSSAGLAVQLREEMERVLFHATDEIDRLGAATFGELKNTSLGPILDSRREFQTSIETAAAAIAKEELQRDGLPGLRDRRKGLQEQIGRAKKELEGLVPKGKQEQADALLQVERACQEVEKRLQSLKLRRQKLDELQTHVEHLRTYSEPTRLTTLRRTFLSAELSATEWEAFGMVFSGNVDGVLADARRRADAAIEAALQGDRTKPPEADTRPLTEWSLNRLRERQEQLKKAVGVLTEKERKYAEVRRTLTKVEGDATRLDAEIKQAEGADQRRKDLLEARRAAYTEVLRSFEHEEALLVKLYEPLRARLSSATGSLTKLEFYVQRRVNLGAWVAAGERLLDLRTANRFRGRGALRKEAQARLGAPWQKGSAVDVAAAIDAFRLEFWKDMLAGKPSSITTQEHAAWVQSVASWLYSTEHLAIEYGIRYDGVSIEQLSPGTRGIVLLMLYLGIDHEDRRPLIIDQPEENLDPKSVFDELVEHFREARHRRQVIIVTHNANLVVNTDADQVIVASSTRGADGGLPTISYRSGSLENAEIRHAVCDVLEGGARAFLERERRYRLRWEDREPSEQEVNR